jgi:hypothetical protein
MKQKNFLKIAMLLVFAITSNFSYGQYSGTGTFTELTSLANLSDGYYVIADKDSEKAMNNTNSGKFETTDITVASSKVTNPATSIVWEIKTDGTGRSIYNEASTKYASYSGSSNTAAEEASVTGDSERWTFTYASDVFTVENIGTAGRVLQYNPGAPRFACYTSNQDKLVLYKMDPPSTDPTVSFDSSTGSDTETNVDIVTAGVPITFTYYDTDVTITPTVNGSSTAESGDYTIDLTPIIFDANETNNIPLTIHADADTDDETIVIDFTVTAGTATLGTSTHTFTIIDDETPPAPSIIITELADPNNSTSGRFVELYNTGTSDIDLATQNIKLRRYTNANTTFTDLTLTGTIAAKSFYIVGKSTFTGIYGFAPNLETTSSIADGNGDDQLALIKDGTIFDLFGVVGEDGSNTCHEFEDGRVERKASSKVAKSTWDTDDWNVWSDGSTASGCTNHNSSDPQDSPTDFDPGSWIGAPRWKGTDNNTWSTTTNWDTGILPSSDADVFINAGLTNYPTASTPITVNSVTIASGASLKATSTFSGDVTYNRTTTYVSGDLKGWFLMASPVVGQDYNDTYVTANDIATKNSNRGIATYTTSSDSWLYHQGAASGTFMPGKGYSVKRQSNTGIVSFTGTLNTNDAGVDFTLSTDGNRFNLLGSPYTSYLSSATFLNNESAISETKTMWVYNQTLGADGLYEVKTVGQDFKIAPGQGFFVQANTAGGTFNFSEANQIHNADTFQKGSGDKTEITLSISDGTINNYGKIYYFENATSGLDIGYDGELFSGQSNLFAVYTHLVSENVGKKYQVQSLSKSNLESMIIPIGVNAVEGKEITFSAETLNLPTEIKVFLEDRLSNTFTRLDETNSEYKITLTEALNGVGRFYLHTVQSVLSTDDVILNSVSIYKTNASTLKIAGIPQGKASISLYNILGKEMMSSSFTSNGSKEISLSKLSSGVYVAKVETEKGVISKKIILE